MGTVTVGLVSLLFILLVKLQKYHFKSNIYKLFEKVCEFQEKNGALAKLQKKKLTLRIKNHRKSS